ncbi:YciI family protein [Kribbella sp. CA-253562]|uniref:YciI family protein n=1 Tax=Kribbella sp. CA-253562 TaxID=3239942 RepID=UPI003D93B642
MTEQQTPLTREEIDERMGRVPLFAVFMWADGDYDQETAWRGGLMWEYLRWQLDLEDRGLLLAAGPLDYDLDVRDPGRPLGMYILAVGSKDEAQRIADQEPFFRLGLRKHRVSAFFLNEGTAIAEGRRLLSRSAEITT